MKNFLTKLLVVLMMVTLALSVVGCKKNKGESESESASTPPTSQSQPESKPESQPESQPESRPEIVPPVTGTPVEGVDVSPVLGVLSPVFSSDYVTIELTADLDQTSTGYVFDAEVDAVAYVKKTDAGFDIIATLTANSTDKYDDEVYSYVEVYEIYYVGGMLVLGEGDEDGMQYIKAEVGTVSSLLTTINGVVASNPDMKQAYDMVMPAVEELLDTIASSDLTGLNVSETVSLATDINGIINFILANENVDVYSFILTNVLGIDPKDSAAVSAFESKIIAIGDNDPTMAQVLDRAVAIIDPELSLRSVVNNLQAELGLTTAQIVDAFNENFMGYWIMEEGSKEPVWSEDNYLPAPGEGVTAYDYFYAVLNTMKLSDWLAEEDFASFREFITYVKSGLQHMTFGQAFDMVLGSIAGDYRYEYVGDGNGDYIYGEYGYEYVGDGYGYYAEVAIDYMAEFKQVGLSFNKLDILAGLVSDAQGRPTSITLGYEMSVNTNTGREGASETSTQKIVAEISFTYAQPEITFVIPSEILDVAEDMMQGSTHEKLPASSDMEIVA